MGRGEGELSRNDIGLSGHSPGWLAWISFMLPVSRSRSSVSESPANLSSFRPSGSSGSYEQPDPPRRVFGLRLDL